MKSSIIVMCIAIFLVTGCRAVPAPLISSTPSPTEPVPTGSLPSGLLPTQTNTQALLETILPSEAPTSTPRQLDGWQVINHLVEFNDMSIVSDHELWAVGQNGIIIHGRPMEGHLSAVFEYRGEYGFHGGCYLNSIDFVSEDDGWMTHCGSELLHWDGEEWIAVIPFDILSDFAFHEVEFVEKNDGWLVGGESISRGDVVLKHWNGFEWQDVSLKSQIGINDINLTAVHAFSNTSVIAIGYVHSRGFNKNGIVLFWDGICWKEIPSQDGLPEFLDVSGTSEKNIWGIHGRFIYHWDGTTWEKIRNEGFRGTPEGNYGTILALSDGEVWIAGYDLLARWDGHAFQDMRPENKLIWVVDLEMSDSGTLYALTRQGEIYRLYE